ncbi:MAG: hypothetical protein MJ252_13165 [archaeon]|nr:hypothetical protein [archaeon]
MIDSDNDESDNSGYSPNPEHYENADYDQEKADYKKQLSYLDTDAKIRLFLEFIFYSEFNSQKKNEELQINSFKLLNGWKPAQMYELNEDRTKNSYIYAWVSIKEKIEATSPNAIYDRLRTMNEVDFNYNSMLDLNPKTDNKNNDKNSSETKEVRKEEDTKRKTVVLYRLDTAHLNCLFEIYQGGITMNFSGIAKDKKGVFYCLKGPISALSKSQDGKSGISGKTTDVQTIQTKIQDQAKPLKEFNTFENGHWFYFRPKESVASPIATPVVYCQFQTKVNNAEQAAGNQGQVTDKDFTESEGTEQGEDKKYEHKGFLQVRDGNGSYYISRQCQNPGCNSVVEMYCETCQKFLCIKCGYEESVFYENKFGTDKMPVNHKVLLLEKAYQETEADEMALEKRLENLKQIIESEKTNYKVLLEKLKNRSNDVANRYNEMQKKVTEAVAREERKRLKELAMLGSNVIRINIDIKKKMEYLTHLKKFETTSAFITTYYIYKNYIANELPKNLLCLEKKIYDYNIKYFGSNYRKSSVTTSPTTTFSA